MGVYNPHVPFVLGQEWVDIRDEGLTFSPSVNFQEVGHTFTPVASRTLAEGHFYLDELPPAYVENQVMQMAVYRTGTEALTGPIREVIIPCTAGAVSGGQINDGLGSTVTAAAIPGLLSSASDNQYIVVEPGLQQGGGGPDLNQKHLQLYFGTSQYAQLLNGKRILKVELVHSFSWDPVRTGTDIVATNPPLFDAFGTNLYVETSGYASSTGVFFSPSVALFGSGLLDLGGGIPIGRPSQATPINTVNFGEINHLWGTPAKPQTYPRLPWRYQELSRFEISAGVNRYAVHYEFGASSTWVGTFYLGYAALKVTFCEEQRLAYGGADYSDAGFTSTVPYVLGVNRVTMYDTSFSLNPVLSAGTQYTVVVSSPDIGDLRGPITNTVSQPASANQYPTLSALRELESSPIHAGVKVNLTQTVGETFTKETTHVLPQLSLHTSGGPLTEVHVYGRQAQAQVYGSITATQEILDGPVGGSASWPWVRYYARRFGDTTVSLNLTIAGQSVAITPTDFDALDEILDGWKEVTLRFTTAPTMGTGTNPQAVWSATGEVAGNRWEVLGAIAPALSGVPGNLLNLAPTVDQLSSATYGQPTSGAGINLGWMPQYAPPVSASADDQTSDAVLMFSQDMATVSGFSVSLATQTLSGVGLDCVSYPWYVPTSLSYNQLSWSPTSSSVPVSGFGSYQLQRMDTITDWQTIAELSSPTASGFRDYEARVGVATSYRIRAINALDFPGQWSSTVSVTSSAPGVSGTGIISTSRVLLFTSNANQDGSSTLAYAKAGDITENFSFPEAGFTQYQLMYNRDYQVAFRPLERGGVVFNTTVLVQAASISPPKLPDFTSLRDLAWDELPYVCVRDEVGDRWFANITVPSGRVMMNRRQLYLADIAVVETTATSAITEV